MAEVFGSNHIYAPRAHPDAARWLPFAPCYLDGITGGQLTIAGDMPVVCSAGSVTSATVDLLGLAGLGLPPDLVTFRAGEAIEALTQILTTADRLVLQHAFPDGNPFAERCWVPTQLLRDLNNKGKLAELVPPGAVPSRRIVDCKAFFAERRADLPIAIKVVTQQSSAGGSGVLICRDRIDLERAQEKFASAGQVVVEQVLEVARSPCLSFAVMPDGDTVYLGHADQDVASDGAFRGNWISFGEALSEEVIRPARQAVARAAEVGYFGFAGVDLVITPDGRTYVVDLNFRLNASTPAVLLAPALSRRLGKGAAHFRSVQAQSSAGELGRTLAPFVERGRIIPLALYDPVAAGYPGRLPVAQLLMVGESQSEVLATEADLAHSGIG